MSHFLETEGRTTSALVGQRPRRTSSAFYRVVSAGSRNFTFEDCESWSAFVLVKAFLFVHPFAVSPRVGTVQGALHVSVGLRLSMFELPKRLDAEEPR
jgi:hypothetical protein